MESLRLEKIIESNQAPSAVRTRARSWELREGQSRVPWGSGLQTPFLPWTAPPSPPVTTVLGTCVLSAIGSPLETVSPFGPQQEHFNTSSCQGVLGNLINVCRALSRQCYMCIHQAMFQPGHGALQMHNTRGPEAVGPYPMGTVLWAQFCGHKTLWDHIPWARCRGHNAVGSHPTL